MTIDSEVKNIYNEILGVLDDDQRAKLGQQLEDLKGLSTEMHTALSKMSELDPETDKDAMERLVKRDIKAVRNNAERLLKQCQQKCPGECESCGATKIDEIAEKIKDYKATIEAQEEDEAKDNVRADLMGFL
jgi:hypothetical protein